MYWTKHTVQSPWASFLPFLSLSVIPLIGINNTCLSQQWFWELNELRVFCVQHSAWHARSLWTVLVPFLLLDGSSYQNLQSGGKSPVPWLLTQLVVFLPDFQVGEGWVSRDNSVIKNGVPWPLFLHCPSWPFPPCIVDHLCLEFENHCHTSLKSLLRPGSLAL